MSYIACLVFFAGFGGLLARDIPSYIQVCQRDQNTIESCVKNAIEVLRPHLANGIPELNVPGLEPLLIPELVVDRGAEALQFKAVGKDVKVYGASNFTIKSISVDLNTFTIKGKVRFPKLHFDGKYNLDARLLALPLHGQGNIVADAVRCEAELLIHGQIVDRDGVEFLKFDSLDMDISVKDYHLKVDGLFDGNKELGEAANIAINANKGEFLRASKPYVERTCTKLLLNIGNQIASSFPLDQLLPYPK